ncbi:hypothetical protein ACWCXB_31505 [Streptomyces sp. NPDC001514]
MTDLHPGQALCPGAGVDQLENHPDYVVRGVGVTGLVLYCTFRLPLPVPPCVVRPVTGPDCAEAFPAASRARTVYGLGLELAAKFQLPLAVPVQAAPGCLGAGGRGGDVDDAEVHADETVRLVLLGLGKSQTATR